MFGRTKTGGLGQVTTKKWKIIKTRKAPGALDPAASPPPRGANTLRSLKICAQVVESFEVGDFSNV